MLAEDPDLKTVKLHLASWGYCTKNDIDEVTDGLDVNLLHRSDLESLGVSEPREHGKLVALQARWRRFQAIKLEVQKRRRRRQLRGIWMAAATLVLELKRRQRLLQARRKKQLLAVFWCSARSRQLLAAVRRRLLHRRRRRRLAQLRAVGQILWSFQRAHRARIQKRMLVLRGVFRASAHLVRSLHRVRRLRKAKHQRQLMTLWRSRAIFQLALVRARKAIRRRRLRGLRGCFRGTVVLLRSCHRARRRTWAAVEIQRHVRTFLERETLQIMAKYRGQRHAVRCFRGIVQRYDAQGELLKLKALAAKMIQTITRGLLCRRKFKELLVRMDSSCKTVANR
eukprot:g29909.t1